MIGHVVEIAGESRYVSLDHGFLVVRHGTAEVGRVPIDDVAALVGNAHGITYSGAALAALASRGCPVVLCERNHKPAGIVWPVAGHHRQAARMDAQLRASLPLRKRLWQQVVRAKIAMQVAALAHHHLPAARLARLIPQVRVGDPLNAEAQAARAYWSALMGAGFRRDVDADGVNAQLNYGYAVLRAIVARHIMAAGLHPGLPLHHANAGNPMRLVDDMMEPFRPVVDLLVRDAAGSSGATVDAGFKRRVGRLHAMTLRMPPGKAPLTLVVARMCASLAQVYEGESKRLYLPAGETGIFDCLLERADVEEGDEVG